MYRNRNMRGGNSTSHSAEYYGNDSGSYTLIHHLGDSAYRYKTSKFLELLQL